MPQYRRKAVMVEAIKLPSSVRVQLDFYDGAPFICGQAGDYLVSADGTLYISKPNAFTEAHESIEISVKN